MAGFISNKELLKQINASDLQAELYDGLLAHRSNKNNYGSLHDSCSLQWIFAFLETLEGCLQDTVTQSVGKLAEMNDLYLRIEEFIVESPEFLTNFPEDQQETMLAKAFDKLEEAKARADAFRWITDEEEEHFLADFVVRIRLAGRRVIDFDHKLKVAANLLFYSPSVLTSLTNKFLELFQVGSRDNMVDPLIWLPSLRKQIIVGIRQLDFVMLYGALTAEIRAKALNLVRMLGALCLFDPQCDDHLKFILYQYLILLSTYRSEAVGARVLEILTTEGYVLPAFAWEDLIIFNPELFAEKISFPQGENAEQRNIEGTFQGHGHIILADGRFSLQPLRKRLDARRMSNFIYSLNGAIEIKSRYKPKTSLNDCTDLTRLSSHWEAVLEDYRDFEADAGKKVTKERPAVGTRLKIRIKNFAASLPLLAFADIVDDQYCGRGALHASEVSRIKITSVAEVLAVGDMMNATVILSTEEKLAFSLLDSIGEILSTRCYIGEVKAAILVARKSNNLLIWCSEKGWPVYTPDVPSLKIQIGETYLLKFVRVYPNGFIKAYVVEPTDEVRIEPQKAVAAFLRDYVEPKDEEDEGLSGSVALLKPEFVRNLLALLNLQAGVETRPVKKFNLLYCARLISYIAKETALEEYFVCCLDYMREVFRFTLGYEADPNIISDEMIKKYPRLAEARSVLAICASQARAGYVEHLLAFLTSEHEKVAGLARLLLARNLLSDHPRMKDELDTEILIKLSFEPEDAGEVNFGRETSYKEFKSSAVFPPESNFKADVDKQCHTILATICGFLNAQGGTLYIGVNDAGLPQGIEMDLQYLHYDEDKYELFLRREILKCLGKDINSQVVIDFQEYRNKTICVISVPAYHDIVYLNETVWQRQGNSTICLDEEAIRLLQQRKSIPMLTASSADASKPESALQNLFSSKDLPQIPSSCLRRKTAERPLVYFTVLQSGKYMLTDDLPARDDSRLTLPFYLSDQNSFLLQIYTSGCVNRVAISNLIKKKRNYEYTNALFNRSEIVFIGVASKEDFLFVQFRLKENEYVRMQSLARIKINQDLSLKGTSLVMVPFDRIVRVDILKPSQARKLKRIETEETKSLGTLTTALTVVDEIGFLEELFGSFEGE